jgi:hypothetical protein
MPPITDQERQSFDEFMLDDDSGECSGIEITETDGEKKAITAVIATFDISGDAERRDLYESMRSAVIEAKRASRIASEALKRLSTRRHAAL